MNAFASELIWIRPLWLLALVPLWLVLFWRWRQLSTESDWQHVVEPGLLEHVIGARQSQSVWHSNKISLVLLALAWTLGVLAAAGPSWEREALPVHRIDGARVLVLDLSESMWAADVAPDRMTRTRFKLRELLRQSAEGETALVVFAGDAHVVMPLTDDVNTIESQVAVLDPGLMPLRGDRLEPALRLSAELLRNGGAGNSHILVMTDGFDDGAAAAASAKRLRKQGHQVTVWAIGTQDGAPISTQQGFVRNQDGSIAVAKLHVEPLRKLAKSGGGALIAATADDADLHQLLSQIDPELKANLDSQQASQLASSQPLDGGVWLLPLVMLLFLLRFRQGWLPVLVLSVSLSALPKPAMAVEWWQRADQKAAADLRRGEDVDANVFDNPAWQGAAQYRSGDFESATDSFTGAGDQAQSWYNRGNALARQGAYQEAIDAYDAALQRQPVFDDASFNRELLQQLLSSKSEQQQQDGESGESGGQESNLSQGDSGSAGAQSSAGGKMDSGGDSQASDGEASPEQASQPNQQTQSDDAAVEEQQSQIGNADDASKQESDQLAGASEQDAAETQAGGDQQLKQKLQQLPEDPGGLLREKFRRQAIRRQRMSGGAF